MKGLEHIFDPKSIAVIGATPVKGKIGHEVLHNLISYEFNGKVFPVNPSHSVIHSIKAYSTVRDVPDAVDCAVIIVPREHVSKVVDQCGEKGVKGLIVITAGFREVGATGAKMEEELTEKVKEYGMRMIGPNCFGVINANPSCRMDATFSKVRPKYGKIGFVSQSGAMGEAIMALATQMNLGFSKFVSIGNKADVHSIDVMEYLGQDPDTEIILLYLEDFGNPRNFSSLARQITKIKPVIAVKAGTTPKGMAAASSHTGALAGSDVSVEALFQQTGILRVGTIEQMFDVASAFARMPLPKGSNVGVVTNAGGPGIIATDSLVNLGLDLPDYAPGTQKKIRPILPPDTPIGNPLDLIAGAGEKEFQHALHAVCHDKNIDSVFAIFVPPITVNQEAVAHSIVNTFKEHDKPMVACFMGVGLESTGLLILRNNEIPSFIFPESAARTLANLEKYRQWKDRPEGEFKKFEVKKKKVQSIINRAETPEIIGEQALDILEAYGFPIAPYLYAYSKEEAVKQARKLGFPVAMKINTPKILHKTDKGAVALDLRTPDEINKTFDSLKKKVARDLKGKEKFSVVIQEMVSSGVETVIGMSTDPAFGPIIMFGLGGIYVEIMKDVAFKINPLSDLDAEEMIKSLKGYQILKGFRGSEPVNMDVLIDSILRISQLVSDFAEIAELDVNPFIISASPKTTKAVDARFIIRK
ncbi:MAG: CoA-binding protein [candidate division Zixibacteria bacterium]|jgi:acetyltransferase|nr:CoA-binding protein [candidate division Zixibacteria bacterium]NIR64605.1 CoA-binding protein [candidate division Zixibacteria bacterium]NIS16728.1 CoA-binding protein [candidate division Zixibacteria bacterium]NIS46463.1 CoA-binding protein [candidate division Zixibacteria bacterium]NIT53117.1 CoA-binding protein [candidate division Zixibacteria bacterium]